MANVYAIASGNWSNTAIWNTGALPTAADDVFSNNFTVTVDQNITVLSLRNTASAPIVAGGGFTFPSSSITASITGATPLAFGAAGLLVISHAAGSNTITLTNNSIVSALIPNILYSGNGDLTFTCPNISVNASLLGQSYISKTGGGTLTLNANCTLVQSSGQANLFLLNSSNGNVIINGNIQLTSGGVSNPSAYTINQTVGTLTINGNISPASAYYAGVRTINFSGTLLTINGNLVSGVGLNVVTTTPMIVNGDVYGNSNASGFGINATSTLTVNGTVYGGAASVAINSTSIVTINGAVSASSAAAAVYNTGTTIINGTITNASNGRMAIQSARLFIGSTPTSMTLYTIGSLTPKVLYSQDAFPNAPAAGDVREGITYGVGGTLVGTLAMPSPSDVRSGVATDATVGTADLTTASIFSAISAATTGVGKRLANVATVQSDGAIIAAFKP